MTARRTLHVPGHFGELLQGRLGARGPVVLVSLPCPVLGVDGWRLPAPGLALHGCGAALPGPALARRLLTALRLPLRGRFLLRPRARPGAGTGVSTASLIALARLAGWQGDTQTLAQAVLACEGASDPLALPEPGRWLWASRLGLAVQQGPALPDCEVLGGFYGPPRRTRAEDQDYPDIADLAADWARARSLPDFAALASDSARRTLAHRGPDGDPTAQLARDTGALGHAISHSGSARALIFAPGTLPPDAADLCRKAGLTGLVRFRPNPQGTAP